MGLIFNIEIIGNVAVSSQVSVLYKAVVPRFRQKCLYLGSEMISLQVLLILFKISFSPKFRCNMRGLPLHGGTCLLVVIKDILNFSDVSHDTKSIFSRGCFLQLH